MVNKHTGRAIRGSQLHLQNLITHNQIKLGKAIINNSPSSRLMRERVYETKEKVKRYVAQVLGVNEKELTIRIFLYRSDVNFVLDY